ncbi:MAG: hypothetical protein APR63_14445 [Desulfuromonas sp. SDB]|nr:MAG: hypothetical protein APR63_14445 [Desulfuromonas sp. SDB]
MNVCDLCNVSLGADSIRYSSKQIKKAVGAGLRPDSILLNFGTALGMSKAETEQRWVQQVMSGNNDWLLCPICAARFERFIP